MKVAAIDIGTNSTRLLIVDYDNGDYKVLERDIIITRLGEEVDKNKFLKENAIERTITALEKYDKKIKKHNVINVKVVGTSALRDVNNKKDFIKPLKKRTSFKIDIISGNKEAKYIYKGVKTDIKNNDFLIIDIGGGSTEFIWKNQDEIIKKSLDIGAVRLTERIIEDSRKPLSNSDQKNLQNEINKILNEQDIINFKTKKLIGVGGTITTLAAMDLGLEEYDSKKIHQYLLLKADIDTICHKLSNSSLSERKRMKGLNEKRADIITAGSIILKSIIEILDIDKIAISERDILFGLINEVIEETL
ncbi:MAG TPA: Ppx/GppA phosphatase family protein [Halanaerobiales bacterium]|nr:Ppx/GppA phosphatase family protein [Halanaerobiales bacterium]